MNGVTEKLVRAGLLDEAAAAVKEAIEQLPEDHELRASKTSLSSVIEDYEAELMRAQVLETGKRADGAAVMK